MDNATLLAQIANGNVIALVPNPRAPESVPKGLGKRWYTMREVADMLGFGLCKVKTLVLTGCCATPRMPMMASLRMPTW